MEQNNTPSKEDTSPLKEARSYLEVLKSKPSNKKVGKSFVTFTNKPPKPGKTS